MSARERRREPARAPGPYTTVGTAGLVALDVVLVVALARGLRVALERVRQPAVMAEVLAGLVLGASVLGALPGDPSGALFPADVRAILTLLGEIAVVAYLFAVGGHLDPQVLRGDGRAVALVGVASFVVPWLLGAGLAVALDVDGGVAAIVFLATALSVTAFPVLARIVAARGLGDRPAGRVALAAAAAQELLVWPALAVALALGGAGGSPFAVLAFGTAAVALVLVLARVVVPRLAGAWPALAGLAASAAATEAAGLHLVLGAFLFGAVLPAGPRDRALELLRRRPAVIAGAAFLPLFFALPAIRVDLGALGPGGAGLLALVLAVAVPGKLGSAALAARLAGLPAREALTVGALMNARGLVELVVLAVGLDAGLIGERLFAVMVLMALVTTFATGPLVDRLGATRRAGRAAAVASPAT